MAKSKKAAAAAAVTLAITHDCTRNSDGFGTLPGLGIPETYNHERKVVSELKARLFAAGFESDELSFVEHLASMPDGGDKDDLSDAWDDGSCAGWTPKPASDSWTMVAVLFIDGKEASGEGDDAVAVFAKPAGMVDQVPVDKPWPFPQTESGGPDAQSDPQPAPAMTKSEAHLGRKPGLFQLTEWTEATLATVTNRAERHGDEKAPGVSLGFQITGPNTILDAFGANLRHTLYARAAGDDQEALDGMDSTPLLRSKVIGRIPLKMPKLEGWRVLIDHGIDEDDPIDLHDCSLKKFFHEPFDGGSGQTDFMASTNDVDKVYLGLIGMKIGQLVRIKVLAPAPKPEAIDGSTEAFERDHPEAGEKDAGDLFAEEHGGTSGDDGAEEQRQQDEAIGEEA